MTKPIENRHQRRATAKRKRTARLYTDAKKGHYWKVPFDDAKVAIETIIQFSKALVCKAKQGICYECVLARGIQDFADANPDAFPHEVHHVYVTRTAIYIVDKFAKDRGGAPSHAIRYIHSFSNLTHSFDKISKAKFLEQYNGFGLHLLLRPAKKGGRNPNRDRSSDVGRKRPGIQGSRGAMNRAIEAGIINLTAATSKRAA
jgi:hypothetical protein